MNKICITFSTSIKSLMNLNQNFFCSLFHILMSKTNYDQLENFQKNWKENWKELVQPVAAFDHKYNTIQKQKKLKVHPLNFEKVLNWTQRKTWSELSE